MLTSVAKAEVLPERIFLDPIAYPRTATTSFQLSTSKYWGQRIMYADASIGRDIPLYQFKLLNDALLLQPNLDAATWFVLGKDGEQFPLLLQDFMVAGGIKFSYYGVFGFIKYNHISAHLGDGMDQLLEKELSAEDKQKYDEYERIASSQFEGGHISLLERVSYSRDFVSVLLGYNYDMWNFDARSYVHGGYANKMFPEELGKHFVGIGTELVYPTSLKPYYAHDITWNGDVNSLDYSGQTGINLIDMSKMNIRIAASFYIGSDRRGQLVGRKLQQLSFGVIIQ